MNIQEFCKKDRYQEGKSSIDKETLSLYILEEYTANRNLEPFTEFIAALEEKQLDEYLKLL